MKTKYIGSIMVLLLVLSAGIAYAHGVSNSNNKETQPETNKDMIIDNHRMMFESVDEMIEEMNEMHALMTSDMEPELKEKMDKLHQGCLNKNNEESSEMMEEDELDIMMGSGMMR